MTSIGPRALFCSFICLLSASCIGPNDDSASSDATQSTWKTESLPLGANEGVRNISVKVDPAGVVHALYFLPSWTAKSRLVYARRDSHGWSTQDLATGWNYGTLALGPDGTPHVAYIWDGGWDVNGVTKGALKYAHLIDRNWVYEDIDASVGDFHGWSAHIAVGSDGVPQVALGTGGGPAMYYARRTDGGWTREQVGEHAENVRIALDPSGAPHIAFLAMKDSNPMSPTYYMVASKVDGSWSSRALTYLMEDRLYLMDNFSFAIDVNGAMHFLLGSEQVVYGYAPTVDTLETVNITNANAAGLAVNDGVAHIAYSTGNSVAYTRVRHSAKLDGNPSILSKETVVTDSNADLGYVSIDLSSSGAPAILFSEAKGKRTEGAPEVLRFAQSTR